MPLYSASGRKVAMPEDDDLDYEADDLCVAQALRLGEDFIITLVDYHNVDNWMSETDSLLPEFPMNSWQWTFGINNVDERALIGIESKFHRWKESRSKLHLVASPDTPFTLIDESDNTWITLPR